MKTITKLIIYILISLPGIAAAGVKNAPDSAILLEEVVVRAKSNSDRLREGAFSAAGIDIVGKINANADASHLIDNTPGIKIRREGGMGSDYELSINGMSGNSVRYFIDGVPLESLGSSMTLSTLPAAMIDHIEVFKGVVPGYLGGDILGGAVNIITRASSRNWLDASISAGSFHSYSASVNARWSKSPTSLILKPTFTFTSSKNDYTMKDVEVWDEDQRKYIRVDRKRFYDDYRLFSGMIEAALEHKSWADNISLTANFSKTDKEIQTGSIQSKVIGDASRAELSFGVGLKYLKRNIFTPGLSARLSLSQSFNFSQTTDTAMRKYDWNGHWIYSPRNEITGGAPSLRHYYRPVTIASAVIDYRHKDASIFTLNYLFNLSGNKRRDDFDKEFEPSNDHISKHVAALSWDANWLNYRLATSVFFKNYISYYSINQTDNASITGSNKMTGNSAKYYPGYGFSARYFLIDRIFSLKCSAENSVRLPSAREMLGNGSTIYANVALRPERSVNLNLALAGEVELGHDQLISYEITGFMRLAKDFIRASVAEKEGMMQYTNEPSVHIRGVDAEINYSWKNLSIGGNISWQDAHDRRRYLDDGNPSATFNNRVPNKPWLFSHLEAGYSFKDLSKRKDNLHINASYDYVHWFFLTWEAYGQKDSKAKIPTQNVVNMDISYSWLNSRYTLSLGCSNIFDAAAYDSYRLQKPGRAFNVTFRIFLR